MIKSSVSIAQMNSYSSFLIVSDTHYCPVAWQRMQKIVQWEDIILYHLILVLHIGRVSLQPAFSLIFQFICAGQWISVYINISFLQPWKASTVFNRVNGNIWVSSWKTLNLGVIPAKHNFEVCRTIEGLETFFIVLIWHNILLRNSDDEGKRKIMKLGIHKLHKLNVFR